MADAKKQALQRGVNTLFSGGLQPEEAPKTSEQAEDVANTLTDEELKAALHKRRMQHRGRPKKSIGPEPNYTDGYGRATTIVNLEKMAKLREIAKRETLTIKEVIEATMDLAISNYEAKHGSIKIYPEEERGDVTKLFQL